VRRDTHAEAVDDSGDAYTQFRGYVLSCCWCRFEARAETKGVALAQMQDHYDSLCGKGRIELASAELEAKP